MSVNDNQELHEEEKLASSEELEFDSDQIVTNEENESDESSDNENNIAAELAETKDKYLRLVAEFDNFRRRNAKERLELIHTAGKDVIISLLDTLDDCDRAEAQFDTTTNLETLKEGILLVFNKLRITMQNKGLKPFVSKHEEFDVEKHEAITEIPAPTEDLKGKVIDEIQKGYLLNDALIRHAKVVVGN